MSQSNLTPRLHRLALSPKKQSQLIADLKNLNEAQKEALRKLLDKHDQECMNIIDQKLAEQKKVKTEMSKKLNAQVPEPANNPDEVRNFVNDIFSSPEHFADFLTNADEEMIAALEEAVLTVTAIEKKTDVRNFFREIRLQKSAALRHEKEVKKEILIKEILKKDRQLKEVNAVIKEVESQI